MAELERSTPDPVLEDLLDRLRPRLRGVFARFGIPLEDAEDLLQQTLLTYLHKKESVEDPERWILGTVRNRCRNFWRDRRRKLYFNVDVAVLETIAEPGRTAQEHSDLRYDLGNVLGKLSARCRKLLELRYTLGCKPAEAAERMGYSPSGIYKVLERCLAGFTRKLVALGLLEESAARSH